MLKKVILIIFLILGINVNHVFLENNQKLKNEVTFLTMAGGYELDIMGKMLEPFEERTGIDVILESTGDADNLIVTRVESGNPPDVANIGSYGLIRKFEERNKLIDMSKFLDMGKLEDEFSRTWIDLGTINNKLVAVFWKSVIKGLIWYNPKSLIEYKINIPSTWDELINVSRSLKKKGFTPWTMGLEDGSWSGWCGTDWIEDILLRKYGPKKYIEWYQGKLKFSSEEVRDSWLEWGKIAADDDMQYGGRRYSICTDLITAVSPLFNSPPDAFFHHQALFLLNGLKEYYPDFKTIEDYDFFKFPIINEKYKDVIQISADSLIMFNDSPQVRELVKYMISPEAQSYWVSFSNALPPNKKVSLDVYNDELMKKGYKILSESKYIVFDASDLMPPQLYDAFHSAVIDYMDNPKRLNQILIELDNIQSKAY